MQEWLDTPAGEYEIGLRDSEARALAEHAAQLARERAARDPDQLHPEREATDLAEMWGNPDYLYRQLAHSMPAHRVTLSAFSIMRRPVTVAEYTQFRVATDAAPRETWELWRGAAPKVPAADEPVTGLSWDEANAFAKWRGAYLAREAEWEAGLRPSSRSPFGDIGHDYYEWCADEFAPYPGADMVACGRIQPPPGGWWGTRTRRAGAIPGFPVSVVTRRGADPTLRLRDTTFRLVRR
jgi:formylglycine-generating enzyme required for sulfatase activity